MKIVILGAGAIGGYFGARLALAGHEVTFVARGAHREAMARDGLRLLTPDGALHLEQPRLLGDPAETGPCEAALVGVKLRDLESAAPILEPLLGPEAAVVPLQNGVAAVSVLSQALGAGHVMGGVAQIAARIEAPGVIRQTGRFNRIIFGELDGTRSARAEALLAALSVPGLEARLSETIEKDIWDKFVMLAPFAGAACHHRAPIGELLDDPAKRAELEALVRECAAVGRAKGVALAEDLAETTMAFFGDLPPETKPSMLHDLEAGQRLEVDWLSGEAVRLGEALDVATPANRAVLEALEPVKAGSGG